MNRPYTGIATGITVALTALAVARIAIGYAEVSQTIDEAVHVAAGVEWLEHHSYRLHPENPPLARVAVGLLPYWHGAQSVTEYSDANRTLGTGVDYRTRLQLGRAGTLPAFVLLVAMVFVWSRRHFGPATALASVFLLTTLPALLGHAGLATTDVAASAATLAAVLAFSFWLHAPSYRRAALLGCAVGVGALVKFTVLLFLAASALGILALRALIGSSATAVDSADTADALNRTGAAETEPRLLRRHIPLQLGVVVGLSAAIVWSGYWGSAGPVDLADPAARAKLESMAPAAGLTHDALRVLLDASLPAPEFFFGLAQAVLHGAKGHSAYLLGEISQSGWWYFFPVAIAVKTPLPFLGLALAGAVSLTRSARRKRDWSLVVPVVAPVAILIALMPSSLNIGLRHILVIFPFLAICGGVALADLWGARRRRMLARSVAAALLLLQLGSSLAAHPHYLAYFNPLVSGHPEDFLIDSDLDWGQDLYRLRDELESRAIEEASLAIFTTADLTNLGLDRYHTLQPGERRRGWVAASIFSIRRQPGYAWLEGYAPVALVGRSIRLYHIDPAAR